MSEVVPTPNTKAAEHHDCVRNDNVGINRRKVKVSDVIKYQRYM